jgi:tetratricopeptide (TPR) repeat protein
LKPDENTDERTVASRDAGMDPSLGDGSSPPARLHRLRHLAHGLAAGLLLSCLRAPLGLDWTQIATLSGATMALFRAAALLGLALALDPTREAMRTGPGAGWLAALCAGYALHGLVLDWGPESRAGYVLVLVLGTLALRALAGSRAERGGAPAPAPPGMTERLGLLLIGAGAALALETLAHETRLFTLATRADDSVLGCAFLALVALGAVAFGPLVARLGQERTRFAAGLGLSASAGLGGLLFLSVLTPAGLFGYLRRFDPLLGPLRALDEHLGGRLGVAALPGLDGASIGTLWTSAILAAAAFVGPGFVLGATLGSTRHAGRLASALLGAAAGLLVLPHLVQALGEPLTLEQLGQASWAWLLVALGSGVAAIGVAVVALELAAGRWSGLALAAAVALVPWLRPRLVLWSFSPWAPADVHPELVWPTAEGLLTVEPARDGTRIVTLDRRRLTPTQAELVDDERCLRLAWELLPLDPPTRRVRGLFIGQLTPERARVLRSLGALELERTAPWHAAMPAIEEQLFRGLEAPPGRILAPAAARAKLSNGDYDWVVAAPTRGPIVSWKSEAREIWGSADAPRLTDLELEPGTVGVAWLPGDSLGASGTSLEPLQLSLELLETFSLALLRGPVRPESDDTGPRFAVSSLTAPRPLSFLTTMPQQRSYALTSAWAASLESAGAPELVRGLRLHFAAQQLSSPYETRALQIEDDPEAFRAFFAAAPAPGRLDRLSRDLWQVLAWLFTEKRMPEEALVYLEPMAERFAPWPALDRAVARAYREVLEPEQALRFLERARTAEPYDVELLHESALCAIDLGDDLGAAGFLEQALRIEQRTELQRALGLAYLRAGDERGRPLLERLLDARPEDSEVRRALGLPPLPEQD